MENFSHLYLRSDVVGALENIGVTQPTVIQMLAIPKIAAGKNVLCASETGMEIGKNKRLLTVENREARVGMCA